MNESLSLKLISALLSTEMHGAFNLKRLQEMLCLQFDVVILTYGKLKQGFKPKHKQG